MLLLPTEWRALIRPWLAGSGVTGDSEIENLYDLGKENPEFADLCRFPSFIY